MGKLWSDNLEALYIVYMKKIGKVFFHTHSLTCLNKDTSVLLKVINIWIIPQVNYKKQWSLKILCICAQFLKESYKILEKEKYTSHTIARLTVFTRVFCHTLVENVLKGPEG